MRQDKIRQEIKEFEREGIAPDDPALITHARKIILPPSPYPILKLNLPVTNTPQAKAALSILKNKVRLNFANFNVMCTRNSYGRLQLRYMSCYNVKLMSCVLTVA